MADYKIKGPRKVDPDAPSTSAPKDYTIRGPKQQEPEGPQDLGGQSLQFLLNLLQNFNDTLTFGTYSKALEATGIDPQAEAKLAKAQEDPVARILGTTAGYLVPGSAATKGVTALSKTLSRNTIPAIMGREAAANAAVSTTDQVVRSATDGDPGNLEFDAKRVLLDAIAGGAFGGLFAGATAAGSRVLSPTARVRARGNDLTGAEKDAAAGLGEYAKSKGITLSAPEALNAAAPGSGAADVEAAFRTAAKSPKGSQTVSAFNKLRAPDIEVAAKDLVDQILQRGDHATPGNPNPGFRPVDEVQDAAQEAIDTVGSGFRNTARPYYESAEPKKIPPTYVSKGGATGQARKAVAKDPVYQEGLRREAGLPPKAPVAPNSILYLDAVAKRMAAMANKSEGDPAAQKFIAEEIQALQKRMDARAPEYATAREISQQGKQAVDALKDGPLGQLTQQRSAPAQASVLLNQSEELGETAAREATRMLDPEITNSLLASHLQSTASKNPLDFGSKAFPTPQSERIAGDILEQGGRADDAIPTIKAAKAVNREVVTPLSHEHTGIWGTIYSILRDMGQGNVAEKLLDPKIIKKLGKMGPVQKAVTRGGLAAGQARLGDDRKKRLDISVPY